MPIDSTTQRIEENIEASVQQRYAEAALAVEPALCCPIEYNSDLLKVIPEEILERDYGCGDPSPYVRTGDVVLDLGSGGGKLCFIASQLVGESGFVIGVDCNSEMLALSRKHAPTVAQRIGYQNVSFRYGMIQDLQLDLDLLNAELASHPVRDSADFLRLRQIQQSLRERHPLIESSSVDCVVSNCVLNLVRRDDRQQLLREIFRVLRPGGRIAISDIVSDETVPQTLTADPELWSGCISGAYREDEILDEFAKVGFHGIEIAKRTNQPWRTVQGIEFRSVTVVAYKGKQGPCLDRNQAVIYRGPFSSVQDDDGHTFERGQRTAVCEKTFRLLTQAPYQNLFIPIEPLDEVPLEQAPAFRCSSMRLRHPRESKGLEYDATDSSASGNCGTDIPCC